MLREDVQYSARFAGLVKRYHTWPTITTQNVAEHTWQKMRIYRKLFGEIDCDICDAILFHDVGEIVTGDLPFGSKTQLGEAARENLAQLEYTSAIKVGAPRYFSIIDAAAKKKIKICDLLEMLEFGVQEFRMGNQYAKPIIDSIYQAVQPMLEGEEYADLVNKWMKVTINPGDNDESVS